MIIRQTPKDKDKYIIVRDNDMVYQLHIRGFVPKYIDEDGVYFIKDKEIENILKGKEFE